MNTIAITSRKRKNIDMSEDTFRALSVLAAANGKNLKAFIETILNNEAKLLYEEALYLEFLKNPETHEIVTPEERATFEEWLAV